MKLRALRLYNVRRFADRGIAIENIGDGVNVLTAANEFGKSTSFDALQALFFQPHTSVASAVKALRPYSSGSPLIEVDVETEKGKFRLTKQFYSNKRANVFDLGANRLIAQADEAERFIAGLVGGNAGGPAGLLWVRQGNTGIETKKGAEEDAEKRARETLLSSVQGAVEEVTGGRRMVAVLASCEAELAKLVTATGKPKAGGLYAAVLDERDHLLAEEKRLEHEVTRLREALDERRKARGRLEELENPSEMQERKQAFEDAQKHLDAAKERDALLKTEMAKLALAQNHFEKSAKELESYRLLLSRHASANQRLQDVTTQRTAAIERQKQVTQQNDAAVYAVEIAEREEQEARDLLVRLDKAMRARDAAQKLTQLREKLVEVEAAQNRIAEGEASVRAFQIPEKNLRELEAIETRLIEHRAVQLARSTVIRFRQTGPAGGVTVAGKAFEDGAEIAVTSSTVLDISNIGTLTVVPAQDSQGVDDLTKLEETRQRLLKRMSVASLTEARQRVVSVQSTRNELELAGQRLSILAPLGIAALREELARLDYESAPVDEVAGDPVEMRKALSAAADKVIERRNFSREIHPLRESADRASFEAEKQYSLLQAELSGLDDQLGDQNGRSARELSLQRDHDAALLQRSQLAAHVDELKSALVDVDNAEALFRRLQSALNVAMAETATLRERVADLTGHIRSKTEDAIEEVFQETKERRLEADHRAARYEREVAVLNRLRNALSLAKLEAREHYFEPVVSELRPLLGLLFEDASIRFDDTTLLPQSIERDGLEESIHVLSGGMREQLSILTRLAFARLLSGENRHAPVILDDALVYSDDDRIERMFDALHRQARDQQIIVFSCRQRAFAKLGGSLLRMQEWKPQRD